MPPLYELHPAFVHIPIGVLLAGAFFKALGTLRRNETAATTSFWLLRLGCFSAVVAAGLGLLAQRTAPHVPAAWETLADHKNLGIATAVTCVILWLVEELRHRRPVRWLALAAYALWVAVVILVLATGNEGGELVFSHGMGVAVAPHL